MVQICNQLKEEFDFVMVDCPAGIEQGFQNAIAGANEAIIITTPEMSAVRDADRIIGLLESKEDILNYKLVLNRVRPKMIQSNDMLGVNDVTDILSVKLLGVIPEDENIIISTNRGEPIVNMENTKAGTAYMNIAKRIMGEEIEIPDFETPPPTFMDRVKNFFLATANS